MLKIYPCERSKVLLDISYLDPQRRSGDMNTVELDVDIMDSVLARHEPDAVLVPVDVLDEAIVGLA